MKLFDIPSLPLDAFSPRPGGGMRLFKGGVVGEISDAVSGIEDTIKDVGSEFDDAVLQPISDIGSEFDDAVLQPIGDAVENTLKAIEDDPLKAAAMAAAMATGQAYLIPYIQGAAALADGASVEDALLSAGKAYVLGQVAGGVSAELSPEFGTTAGNAAGAGATAAITGGDPLQAMVNSGMNSGLNAAVNSGIDAYNTPSTQTTDSTDSTTPWPVQDLGVQSTDTEFYSGEPDTGNAGTYDPFTGNTTYTYDDGSTISYDENGDVTGSTESTDTPYTEPDTGTKSNIKLPSVNFFAPTMTSMLSGLGGTGTSTVDPMATADTSTDPMAQISGKRPGATAESGMLNPLLFSLAGFQSPKQEAAKDPFSDLSLGTSFAAHDNTPPEPMQTFAQGGLASMHPAGEPQFYSEGGLNNRYIKGEGDGTSDSIPAMVADSEFVMPADVVAALGNGSSDAGASKLDQMVEQIRKRARSTSPSELPPTAHESPLDYLKGRA